MNKRDSEALTRVGPGTPMGELFRQYWLPAAMSSEIVADGPPVRLALLGERLILFRDSAGRVGVFDHRCPHRGASLFLGRNEEGGLRCVYHGWKFDVAGSCLDMPSVPAHQDFRGKVRAKAYSARERNGLVWVYMGARAEPPPLPAIEATLLPESDVQIFFAQRECNWLQALEGDIDTSHFGFLHAGGVDPATLPADNLVRYTITNRAPEYHVADTPWGTLYGAYRPADARQTYWRFASFLFPFWTLIPQGPFERVHARGWVPLDDTHTMFVSIAWKHLAQPLAARGNSRVIPGSAAVLQYLPNGTGWFDRWRLAGNAGNNWLIDREAQKSGGVFTGIAGIYAQDQAVTESMGGIVDHAFEHLGPGDRMITRTRRRLLAAVRAFAKDSTLPPGVDDPEICAAVRSGDFLAEAGIPWREAYAAETRRALRPQQQAAE